MKKIIEKQTFWQCRTCKAKYKKKRDAADCERKGTEEQVFQIGDSVRNREPRQCHNGKNYHFHGKIIKVVGPEPPDEDYERRWLGGQSERLNNHVYSYVVEYRCSICREKKEAIYFAPELLPIKRRKNKKSS